jgi:long-chain acyl-CoA synthetase
MGKRLDEVVSDLYQKDPEREYLWWNGEWWSRARFNTTVNKLEKVLSEAGFEGGQRLVTMLPNSPLLLALSVACWRLSGTIVPLNLQAGPHSLVRSIRHADPFVILVPDSVPFDEESLGSMGIPVVKGDLNGNIPSFHGEKRTSSRLDVAVMFYTSGTTGLPKAVPLSGTNIYSNVEAAAKHFSAFKPEECIILNALPNFHTLGYSTSGLLPLLTGARQVVLPHFMPPDRTLQTINATGVNFIIAVPAMISLLVAAAAKGNVLAPKTITTIVSGGDRFPMALDNRVRAIFGVEVMEGYGLTECSPVVAVNPDRARRKIGTVGTLLPGFEYEIRDESGKVLPSDKEGVLWLRGPSVAQEYFNDPENTAQKFKDGWFDTGDVVRIDSEGYISIVDRVSDIIIVGGFNVYPQEVEEVLNSYPGIKESAVVGVPHSMSGQIVKAFVIRSNPKVTSKELYAYCKAQLAHYKTPRIFEFVEDFPRNSIGKVLRRKLREG